MFVLDYIKERKAREQTEQTDIKRNVRHTQKHLHVICKQNEQNNFHYNKKKNEKKCIISKKKTNFRG